MPCFCLSLCKGGGGSRRSRVSQEPRRTAHEAAAAAGLWGGDSGSEGVPAQRLALLVAAFARRGVAVVAKVGMDVERAGGGARRSNR